MIKTLLVDDETLARKYVKGLLDWEPLGFTICGEASNGAEALELVRRESPRLVITDVHMAGMDGVALCKRLAEEHKDVRMLVLSSYDTYDFVRETMVHGATDYLLKHRIDAASLSARLLQVKNEIEQERRAKREEDFFAKNRQDIALELSNRFAKALVLGDEAERRKAEQYFADASPIGTRNLAVCAMEVLHFHLLTDKYAVAEKNKFVRAVEEMCKLQMEDANGIVCHVEEGEFLFLFSFERQKSEYTMLQLLHACFRRIERSLADVLQVKALFGASRVVGSFRDVHDGYAQSRRPIEELRLRPSARTGTPDPSESAFSLSLQQERDLVLALEQGDREQVKLSIDNLFGAMRSRGVTVHSVQFTINELIELCEKMWRKLGRQDAHFYEGAFLTRTELSRIDQLERIEEWTQRLFSSLLDRLPPAQDHAGSVYVKAAKKYVKQSFRQNISLEQAAEFAGITPSYLSRLFKQEEGLNFTDYLNRVRIEQAKRLIRAGNVNMKCIYQEVGFSSYNYFFKVFKDISGMTPHTYAKQATDE